MQPVTTQISGVIQPEGPRWGLDLDERVKLSFQPDATVLPNITSSQISIYSAVLDSYFP